MPTEEPGAHPRAESPGHAQAEKAAQSRPQERQHDAATIASAATLPASPSSTAINGIKA